jgi:protein-L-isoaspartate(D-aspartate) O-methyltransferase
MPAESDQFKWNKDYFLQVITSGKSPKVTSPKLIEAFELIDRKDFLPENYSGQAYYDDPDNYTDEGHFIESPFLQAELLSKLELKEGMRVLEVGTGSGFLTAIISHVVGGIGKIYSLERDQLLIQTARQNLRKYPQLTSYDIVFTDGAKGLIARAPYDAIYVSVAYEALPDELITQLKVGGKMICPLTNMEIRLVQKVNENEYKDELIAVHSFAKVTYGVE